MTITTVTGVTRLFEVPSAPRATGGNSRSSAPLKVEPAAGNSPLSKKQVAAELGAPVPIVFCRRVTRDGLTSGGVLISPPAIECRFENDASNTLTARYRLLLSEGRLAGVQVRDVFQISCRVGAHAQAFNGPAGSWTAGNFMVDRAGFTEQECPTVCGGGGSYLNLSNLSFECTYPNGDTTWDQQVHVFVRSGVEVKRLLDGGTGPSNNFADLMALALGSTKQVPSRLIDSVSLLAAAKFLDVNGLAFDGIIDKSHNLADYLNDLAPLFLLQETKLSGRFGLRPLLPVTSTGAINTGTIDWAWQFTEDELTGRFEQAWSPLSDRRPYCSVVSWRQQPDDDMGMVRTFPYCGSKAAESGPNEALDLSAFVTTENHAVKVAAYQQAKRAHVTHTLEIDVKPGPWSGRIAQGDIVRVTVPRRLAEEGTTWHDYLYEVAEVIYGGSGELTLGLWHFPVNRTGQSIVALAVANAVGTGTLLPTVRTGPSCDTNSSSSTSAVGVSTGNGRGSNQIYTTQGITVDDLIGDQQQNAEAAPGGTTEAPSAVIEDGGVVSEPVNNDEPKVDSIGGQLFAGVPFILIKDAEFERTFTIRRTWIGISPRLDTQTITLAANEEFGSLEGGKISFSDGSYRTVFISGTNMLVFNRKTGSDRTQTIFGYEALGITLVDDYLLYQGPQPVYDVTGTIKGTSRVVEIFNSSDSSDGF